MATWVRKLRSGQEVPYTGLPFEEVLARGAALDEWDMLRAKRAGVRVNPLVEGAIRDSRD